MVATTRKPQVHWTEDEKAALAMRVAENTVENASSRRLLEALREAQRDILPVEKHRALTQGIYAVPWLEAKLKLARKVIQRKAKETVEQTPTPVPAFLTKTEEPTPESIAQAGDEMIKLSLQSATPEQLEDELRRRRNEATQYFPSVMRELNGLKAEVSTLTSLLMEFMSHQPVGSPSVPEVAKPKEQKDEKPAAKVASTTEEKRLVQSKSKSLLVVGLTPAQKSNVETKFILQLRKNVIAARFLTPEEIPLLDRMDTRKYDRVIIMGKQAGHAHEHLKHKDNVEFCNGAVSSLVTIIEDCISVQA